MQGSGGIILFLFVTGKTTTTADIATESAAVAQFIVGPLRAKLIQVDTFRQDFPVRKPTVEHASKTTVLT